MFKRHTLYTIGAICVAVAAMASVSSAAVIIAADFGEGAAYTGTNTPYHAATGATDPLAFTQVSSTGNATVSGYLLDLGRDDSKDSPDQLELARPVAYAAGTGTGIFNTDLTNDAVVDYSFSSTAVYRSPVGLQVQDLEPGSYRAYLILNFASNTATSLTGYGLVSSTDYADLPLSTMNNLGDVDGSNTTTWVNGENYLAWDFTIANGDYLYLAGHPTTYDSETTGPHGTFAGLIIEQIPEPASVALFGIGGLLIGTKRRRH